MKAWFVFNHRFPSDEDSEPVKVGINWYRHAKPVKMFKPWRGFTIDLYFFKYWIRFNIVDDYAAYRARIDYRRDPDYMKNRLEALKAAKEKKC